MPRKKAEAAASSGSVNDLIAAVNAVGEASAAQNATAEPKIETTAAGTPRPRKLQGAKTLGDQWREASAEAQAPKPEPDPNTAEIPKIFLDNLNLESTGGTATEEGAESATPEAAAAPAQETEGGIPQPLINAAYAWGLDPDDYASPKALAKAIEREADRVSKAPPAATQTKEPEQPPAFDPFNGKREDFDEQTQKLIEHLHSHFDTKLTEANKRADQLEQVAQRQRATEIDKVFSDLDGKYAGVFGKKPIHALRDNTPEFLARKEVGSVAIELSKRSGKDFTEELERAAAIVYGQPGEEAARNVAAQQTTHKLNGRRGQMLGSPSHREPAPLNPRDEGVDYVKRFLANS